MTWPTPSASADRTTSTAPPTTRRPITTTGSFANFVSPRLDSNGFLKHYQLGNLATRMQSLSFSVELQGAVAPLPALLEDPGKLSPALWDALFPADGPN